MKKRLFAIISGLVMIAVLWGGPYTVMRVSAASEDRDATVQVAGYIAADTKTIVPEPSEKQEGGETPKTGDSFDIDVWIFAGVTSFLLVLFLLAKKGKQNQRQSEF